MSPRTVVNKMKANEIRSMSVQELESKLVDLKKDLVVTSRASRPCSARSRTEEVRKNERNENYFPEDPRKTRVGKVVSDKMDKTVVVTVEDRVAHKTYKKIIGRTYRLKAHDENNECGVGDIVRVMETRPLSKDKRWRVVEIVEKAK